MRPCAPLLLLTLAVALIATSTAGAASLKVPAPAAGEVAVAAAPVTGTAELRVGKAGVPKGAVVTGGVVKAGGKRVALVAVIRPKNAAKTGPSIGAGRAQVGGGASASAVLGAQPPVALTAAVAPACAGAAKALGHPLRRGAGAPSGSDLAGLGRILAARLCGGTVDAKGIALLGLLGLKAPSPAVPAKTAGPVAGAAAGALAPPAPAPPGLPVPSGADTTPPPTSGTNQCNNGKDDDGDGQIDALGAASTALYDPGCSGPTDPTESSEKTLPAQCGKGVALQGSRVGFAVDVDSRKDAACPKAIAKGYVDLMTKVTACDGPGWDDGHGDGSCATTLGVLAIVGKGGDAFHGYGKADMSLCGTRAVAVAITADGTAYERDATIADTVGACTGPVPPAGAPQCSDGIDNDYDGRVGAGGVADSGPDPGCSSAADATELEDNYPATGCWNLVASDPGDPSIAYIYVLPHAWDSTCPTMDAISMSFDYLHATACVGQPYWNGTAAGTCTIKNGDVWLSGGSGQRVAVAVKIDGPAIVCDDVFVGATSMRAAGLWHEAVTEAAWLDGDQLTECS